MESGIYLIKNKANGKIYIGSTNCFKRRWIGHRSELKLNKHHSRKLQSSWNKYGEESFLFEIVERCSIQMLIDREQFWINLLDPWYNISRVASCPGNTLKGKPWPEKRRAAHQNKPEGWKRAKTTPYEHKPHSPETIEKLRVAARNRKPITEETRAKLRHGARNRKAKI